MHYRQLLGWARAQNLCLGSELREVSNKNTRGLIFQIVTKMTLKLENSSNRLFTENAAFIKLDNDVKFTDKGGLGTLKFICFLCKAVFQSKRYLKYHTKRVHCDPVKCDICAKELSNKKQLSRHVRKVHVKREISNCEICGKTLKSFHSLKNHRLKCGRVRKSLPCRICQQDSKSNISPLIHKTNCYTKPKVKKIVNMKESPVCIICRKSFHSMQYMKKHMVISHEASNEGGNIRYKIKKHGEIVENVIESETLQKLLIKCAEDFARRLVCVKCGKDFATEKLVLEHKQEKHIGEKVFECDRCDGMYFSKSQVGQHRSRVHKVRNHACLMCGNKFKLRAHLQNHTDKCHPPDRCEKESILS